MADQLVGRWGLRVPSGGDGPPNVPAAMLKLATDLSDVAKDGQGTLAARPVSTALQPSNTPGRYYFVTGDPDPLQNRRLYRDTGTGWEEVPVGPGSRWDLGDYKMSAQTADHGDLGGGNFAWLLCNARELPASQTRLVTWLNTHPSGVRPFGTGANGRPLLPDPRGRVPVFLGTNAEVDVLGESDGLAVGDRRPRHRSSVTDPGHRHPVLSRNVSAADGRALLAQAVPIAYNDSGGGDPFLGNSATGITVGPAGAGPVDAPAHLVLGHLFIRAD